MLTFTCLLCGQEMPESSVDLHRSTHSIFEQQYGFMWPHIATVPSENLFTVQTVSSPFLAQKLGVNHVYIRFEGNTPSGSMKDYIVHQALQEGTEKGFKAFTVVSSGNHAFSLAFHAQQYGTTTIVFTPASSSKLSAIARLPRTIAIGVTDAIFEDVYRLAAKLSIPGVYNANVSNEHLLLGLLPIAREISNLDPRPTHVLSGVGNGTYLSGIALGLQKLIPDSMPKIVAVGMKGAFPTETAHTSRAKIHEYEDFNHPEKEIDAAEGSIALASYSMPQLMHALHISQGFTIGSLTNETISQAYALLLEDPHLAASGIIPEPTGILGLAAAESHRWNSVFSEQDVLHISFTGSGARCIEEVMDLVDVDEEEQKALHGILDQEALRFSFVGNEGTPVLVPKDITPNDLAKIIHAQLEKGESL